MNVMLENGRRMKVISAYDLQARRKTEKLSCPCGKGNGATWEMTADSLPRLPTTFKDMGEA